MHVATLTDCEQLPRVTGTACALLFECVDMVGRRAAVRSIVPGEAGGGRALSWSVPLVTRTDGNLTSSAQLEA